MQAGLRDCYISMILLLTQGVAKWLVSFLFFFYCWSLKKMEFQDCTKFVIF
jgi:hypothetical protein